jgi:hypothetical protein
MIKYIFIDESCHLEKDRASVMCIGFIKVQENAYEQIKQDLTAVKRAHRVFEEVKWSGFSKSRLPLYKDFVDYFFSSSLEFKCILVKYKERLKEIDLSRGSHENFYYKMIEFLLASNSFKNEYKVFLDVINSRGRDRINKIRESLTANLNNQPFLSFQHLHSHHNIFFEIADLFIGAIAYSARKQVDGLPQNLVKNEFISYLEKASGYSLSEGTELWETKFNIIDHQPKQRQQ